MVGHRELEPRSNEASDAAGGGERVEELAKECELELCGYAGECNQCETPTGRTWAKMFRGECEEVSEYVCEKCLPAYHKAYLENLASWIAYADDEILERGRHKKSMKNTKRKNESSMTTPSADCNPTGEFAASGGTKSAAQTANDKLRDGATERRPSSHET